MPNEVLHRNFFARDSSAMSPWGALICHMQLKSRRADYVTAIRFYQSNEVPIWRYATAGHFEGGDFNILEPGLVLIGWNGERSEREGSEQVAEWVREQGWEAVVAPISREFVHMDGLVVPLGAQVARGLRRRLGGLARGLAARGAASSSSRSATPKPGTSVSTSSRSATIACFPCAGRRT